MEKEEKGRGELVREGEAKVGEKKRRELRSHVKNSERSERL